MRKIKYLILLVICAFLLTNNVFAASDYYEHIWTNSYEEELKYNEDGTVSVSTNKFTMPADDAHIIAHFEKTEPVPDTSDNIMLYVTILIGGIAVLGTIIYRRNHT